MLCYISLVVPIKEEPSVQVFTYGAPIAREGLHSQRLLLPVSKSPL